jgi:hypothetical protein
MNDLTQQPATNNEQPATRFKCRHIFTDGHRCGSICLRNEPFCYYHHTTRKPAPRRTFGSHASFDLPLPEDRSAIQASIGIILQRIASNDLDPKRAGLLLYGLQIASLNLPKQKQNEDKVPPEQVHEVTNHPELGTLAPEAEIKEKKSFAAKLLEELTRPPQPKPAVLPQIQAVAQPCPRSKPAGQSSPLRSRPSVIWVLRHRRAAFGTRAGTGKSFQSTFMLASRSRVRVWPSTSMEWSLRELRVRA